MPGIFGSLCYKFMAYLQIWSVQLSKCTHFTIYSKRCSRDEAATTYFFIMWRIYHKAVIKDAKNQARDYSPMLKLYSLLVYKKFSLLLKVSEFHFKMFMKIQILKSTFDYRAIINLNINFNTCIRKKCYYPNSHKKIIRT